jgi:hypothetical protein
MFQLSQRTRRYCNIVRMSNPAYCRCFNWAREGTATCRAPPFRRRTPLVSFEPAEEKALQQAQPFDRMSLRVEIDNEVSLVPADEKVLKPPVDELQASIPDSFNCAREGKVLRPINLVLECRALESAEEKILQRISRERCLVSADLSIEPGRRHCNCSIPYPRCSISIGPVVGKVLQHLVDAANVIHCKRFRLGQREKVLQPISYLVGIHRSHVSIGPERRY